MVPSCVWSASGRRPNRHERSRLTRNWKLRRPAGYFNVGVSPCWRSWDIWQAGIIVVMMLGTHPEEVARRRHNAAQATERPLVVVSKQPDSDGAERLAFGVSELTGDVGVIEITFASQCLTGELLNYGLHQVKFLLSSLELLRAQHDACYGGGDRYHRS